MANDKYENTPFMHDDVGFTLKVVKGPNPAMFGNGNPGTTGGCYQVATPYGELLLRPYTPSYYNPPLAYDRCSTSRPFGPRPTGCGGCNCAGGCSKCKGQSGQSSSPCGAKIPTPQGLPASTPTEGPYGEPYGYPNYEPRSNCEAPCYKGNMGYAGEHTNPLGPYYRNEKYQAGYFAPQYVNGPPVNTTVGQPKKKTAKEIVEEKQEKKIIGDLLEGNLDALLDNLLIKKKATKELAVVAEQATVGRHRTCLVQPPYINPTQFYPQRFQPRAFVPVFYGKYEALEVGGNSTVSGCGCRNQRASYFDKLQDWQSDVVQTCPKVFQGWYNPWGQVNGPRDTVGQKKSTPSKQALLNKDMIETIADTIIVSTGFNPEKNDKLRTIVQLKLESELGKRGYKSVGGFGRWIRRVGKEIGKGVKKAANVVKDVAPSVLLSAATGNPLGAIQSAVEATSKFVDSDIMKPMTDIVQKNAGQVLNQLSSIDKNLGITQNLKQFASAGGLESLSKQLGTNVQWPQLAGLALTAATGGGAAPVLNALQPAIRNLPQAQGIQQIANSLGPLLGGVNANQLGLGGGLTGIGNNLAANITRQIAQTGFGGLQNYGASAFGGLMNNLYGVDPRVQALQARLNQPVQVNPLAQLMQGRQGLLGLVGQNAQAPGQVFNQLNNLGNQMQQGGQVNYARLVNALNKIVLPDQ